ncbi:HAD-like domain-containing protein [Chiua virens]|nr:HAD-like domain-containing protein [Chiua virens]
MAFRAKAQPPIQALLIDISGTLLIGSSSIAGAAQALAKLRAAHIPFRFCSNTSKESSEAIHKRMQAAGLDVRRAELWTSIGALKSVLKELGVKRPYMLLSQSALEECAEEPETQGEPSSPSSPYDAVVVGLAPALLDYAHLNTAFRILTGEDRTKDALAPASRSAALDMTLAAQTRPPLIALHKGRYLEAVDHALSLGPGPFVHALEDAARTSATVVGKPTRAFFEAVLRDLDRDLVSNATPQGNPGRQTSGRWDGIAVIGDDVSADLGDGAVELGLWRVLVKTGKYRSGDEERMDTPPPDQVCSSFPEKEATQYISTTWKSTIPYTQPVAIHHV